MYVYQQTEPGVWTVGFYTPGGEWISESDHPDRDQATDRVAHLNGGVQMGPKERAAFVLSARKNKLPPGVVAQVLGMDVEKVEKFLKARHAAVNGGKVEE